MASDLKAKILATRSSASSNDQNNSDGFDLDCTFSHEYLKTDPAFNPAEVSRQKPSSLSTTSIRDLNPLEATKEVASSILHPRRALFRHVEGKTAKSLSKATRPYITPEADREFLAAHDALFEAESQADKEKAPKNPSRRRTLSGASKRDRKEDEKRRSQPPVNAETQRRKVELLEAHRQSVSVAWITSRHLKCVRLAPSKVASFPSLEDEKFVERDGNGTEVRFMWESYLGQLLLYYSQPFTARYVDVGVYESPFDVISLVERLVMATEPWQAWWMGIRDLYRWERPWRTAFWYGVFSILWYTQHVVGFLYAYIIFIVLKNRFYPMDVTSMRESLDRVLDRGAQAYRCGELVDRYGREGWLQPLLDEMAPFLRLQLGDLATFLEILRNFYYWRNPSKTAATLFFFSSCLLVSLVADMEFCMKIVWFIAINTFFLCWPVSSRYPRYRWLVSPIRWVFWDIASYQEWAILFLQQHEILRRHEMKTHGLSHGDHTFSHRDFLPSQGEAGDEVFYDSRETQDTQPRIPDQANGGIKYQDGETTAPYVHAVYFTCYQHGHEGQLIVSMEGLRFVENPRLLTALHNTTKQKPRLDQKPQWSYNFSQLVQMSKQQSPAFSKLAGLERNMGRLDFEFVTESAMQMAEEGENKILSAGEVVIETSYGNMPGTTKTKMESLDVNRAERDEIFNLIVGWSRSRWQATGAKNVPATKK